MRRALITLALLGIAPTAAAAPPCDAPVPIYEDGAARGGVCPAAAAEAGLTVLDLGNAWAPLALADDAAPAYRATYLALADERFADAGDDRAAAERDRAVEVYGILPSLDVVRARLGDLRRHLCHAAIVDAPLAAVTGALAEESPAAARARRRAARRRVVVATAQRHLVCDGLLQRRRVDGQFTWRTDDALEAFQRRNVLLPDGHLDEDTRALLLAGSREQDLRAALRVLRERVIAATGLIEDGSAGDGAADVLGRPLDPAVTTRVPGHAPLPDAAPDLVSAATAAAASALGWTTPDGALAFLAAPDRPRAVAVRLPALPAYHRAPMRLAVEIDRGDVWYDPEPRARTVTRRPALILYALDGERRIPLVRWPTTIGGWQNEKLGSGVIVPRWKESPVGPRVWRTLYVAPVWLPPASTPDVELVRALGGGRHELKREAIGPSYRSAYGLAMFIHTRRETRRGRDVLTDTAIRTHGSGNVPSILSGHSHGCHRLLPVHALRLLDFLLRHVDHVRRGEDPTWYTRIVRHGGRFRVHLESRGYRIDLVDPVPVEVLPGTIRSRLRHPPRP